MDKKESRIQLNRTNDNLEIIPNQTLKERKASLPSDDFTEKSWKTDFTLIVDGTKLYVAKNILALASPVFERMIQSSFKENTEDAVELPGKSVDDVKEFLRCIYPNKIAQITFKNAIRILPLVEEFQVLHLKPRCVKVLLEGIDESTSTATLFVLLKIGGLYNMSDVIDICINFASEKTKQELEVAESKCHLPAEHLREIYQKLIARLEDKVSDLEDKVIELENLNRKFDEQVEIHKTWKNSLTACLDTLSNLQLREKSSWSGRVLTLELTVTNLAKQSRVRKNFFLWYTKFSLDLDVSRHNDMQATISILEDRGISCEVETQFVVMNHICAERSETKHSRFLMNRPLKTETHNIAYLDTIKDPEKGFVRAGKVQLMAYIFVSKPVLITN